LLGGIAILLGIGFAYYQFTLQQRLARDLLIRDQVLKGFDQLGNQEMVVRLGGVYALEGVMNTSDQYHQPVLEALSAFVRYHTRDVTGNGPPETDIQAALTVIARRKVLKPVVPDLNKARIPKARLIDANLGGADLTGANLTGAQLYGKTDLAGAFLSEADLSGANLQGASLSKTKLNGAILNGADLTGARFIRQAQLDDACGTGVKLDPGLTIKPCPASPP
jgi:Pentapeptide repeats (8 copies)